MALIVTGEDLQLRLWDARTMQPAQLLPAHTDIPLCCDCSNDGVQLPLLHAFLLLTIYKPLQQLTYHASTLPFVYCFVHVLTYAWVVPHAYYSKVSMNGSSIRNRIDET